MDDYKELKNIIDGARRIVFFGGAGVSTESGIPDFRSADGLYSTEFEGMSPETMLSIGYFRKNPSKFYRYYKSHMLFPDIQPNEAHRVLAQLEQEGKLSTVVTQNIDGLHQKAGSKNVLELHGTALENSCVKCGKKYDMNYILDSEDVPTCTCGGIIRPDIVFYGEGLNDYTVSRAIDEIEKADVLIVGGTSLTVQPAASFVSLYRGDDLILINKTPTPYDGAARLIFREPIGKVLGSIYE